MTSGGKDGIMRGSPNKRAYPAAIDARVKCSLDAGTLAVHTAEENLSQQFLFPWPLHCET